MSENSKTISSSSSGISFLGLLAIVFITLKLAQIGAVAHWPWLWVLSPLWIPLAIIVGILVVAAFIGLIAFTVESICNYRRRRKRHADERRVAVARRLGS